MLKACLPDASHLSNATLLRVLPPAQSTTMLSQGLSPDDQGYAATCLIRKPLPTLTTSKKPTTSNPDTNASANGRVHKVENGCKGDREMREIILDVSRHVRTTQNTHPECITPAPAGQSPKMMKDASSRSKCVPLSMPP